MNKRDAIAWLVANCDCWKGQEVELNKLSEPQLQKMQTNTAKAQADADALNAIKTKVGTVDADAIVANQKPKDQSVQTMEQWEASMPPAARAVWNAAKELIGSKKGEIIGLLVENVADEHKPALIAAYNKLDENELKAMLAVKPAKSRVTPNYSGGGNPISRQVNNATADKKAILKPVKAVIDQDLRAKFHGRPSKN